jgi:hypothetical protein
MSFSRAGFPAAFATEADPMAGLFDPFVHTVADRMDLSTGEFSFEVGSEKASKRNVQRMGWEGVADPGCVLVAYAPIRQVDGWVRRRASGMERRLACMSCGLRNGSITEMLDWILCTCGDKPNRTTSSHS